MLVATFVLAAAAGIAGAQPQRNPTAPRHATSAPVFSVAGIRLGMSPSDVAGATRGAGYRLVSSTDSPSWAATVAHRLLVMRSIRIQASGRVPGVEDYRNGEERLEVRYRTTSRGAEVWRVTYVISGAAMDAATFRRSVLSRYGRPTRGDEWQSLYCSVGDRVCSSMNFLDPRELPTLAVQVSPVTGHTIILSQGARAEQAWEAELRAEMERLAPRQTRTTF
jgi:hypothetical protein